MVKQLGKLTKQPLQRLYVGNVRPAVVYGAEATGYPPRKLQQNRTMAAQSISSWSGQCCTTVIQLAVGAENDPGISVPTDAIRAWLRLWPQTAEWHAPLERAWQAIRERLGAVKVPWSHTRGHMGVVQNYLRAAGWLPERATVWKQDLDTHWQLWQCTGGTEIEPVLQAFWVDMRAV